VASGSDVVVRPLAGRAEAENCARMMAASEPWITLGRGYEASLALLQRPDREVHVAVLDGTVAGFIVVAMQGAFVGYIQTVCVAAERRGRGIGTRLVSHAEERIFRETPNVFLCVSSFNPDARRLYERLGYSLVGALPDYLVTGHSELLYRKTIGPIGAFRPDAAGAMGSADTAVARNGEVGR
jgi:[ribosomal protein S18]-alanine N-acetyltransferase